MEEKRKLNRAGWVEVIRDFEKSGLSLKKFGEERGLALHGLQYWRRKLRMPLGSSEEVAGGFSQVRLLRMPEQGQIQIELSGLTVRWLGRQLPSASWVAELSRGLSR